MANRKRLTISAQPTREPETIRAEIAVLEAKLRVSANRPGLHDRAKAIQLRLDECRNELAALDG